MEYVNCGIYSTYCLLLTNPPYVHSTVYCNTYFMCRRVIHTLSSLSKLPRMLLVLYSVHYNYPQYKYTITYTKCGTPVPLCRTLIRFWRIPIGCLVQNGTRGDFILTSAYVRHKRRRSPFVCVEPNVVFLLLMKAT